MNSYPTEKIRNIVLLGNAGSGKTTLSETMLFEGKVIDRRGTIENKNTVSDNSEVEHIYQRSIYSTILYTEFMERKLNFIDPSGSDDFSGSLFPAFKVCDTGVMLINAQNGVEVGTQIQLRYAESHRKPVIFAINQLDHEKADYDAAIQSIKETLGNRVAIVQYPVGLGKSLEGFIDVLKMKMYKFKGDNGEREELPIPDSEMEKAVEYNRQLVETSAEHDDALMELFFEKGTLDEEEIRRGLRAGLKAQQVFPVFCLSAKRNIGTKRLMEFIINVAPSPEKAREYKTVKDEIIPCDSNAATSIFIFKSSIEQHLGEVSYFRVMSGTLAEGMDLVNAATGDKERLSQIYAVAGKNRVKVASLSAGDIGCTVKLKSARMNQTMNAQGKDWVFYPVKFPDPKFRTAIKAKNSADDERLGELLNKAHFEDPSVIVEYSKELKQTIICGQGEHHLNILKWSLEHLHKLPVEFVVPKIPYRETITKTAQADYRHKKQSGGAGQFGEVHLLIEPYIERTEEPKSIKANGQEYNISIRGKEEYKLEWGGKLIFYNCIVGGVIDARFLPAIVKGIMEKMEEGPLTGSYARDIRVYCYDGKMHPVDSNEISFKLAGRNAFKDAFKKAGPKLMEPIYAVEVLTPSDCMGDVMSDLQNRRAIIMGMENEKGFEVVKARVPLSELYRYSTTLGSLSSGRATYTMTFLEYQQTPAEIQEKLLKEYEAQEKEE